MGSRTTVIAGDWAASSAASLACRSRFWWASRPLRNSRKKQILYPPCTHQPPYRTPRGVRDDNNGAFWGESGIAEQPGARKTLNGCVASSGHFAEEMRAFAARSATTSRAAERPL